MTADKEVRVPYPGEGCDFTLTTTASYVDGSVWEAAFPFADRADVAAPGTHIATTHYQGDNSHATESYGTSFSAPHTAGVAHLLKEMGVPVYAAFNTIRWSAQPIPNSPCDAEGLCKGRINAWRALRPTLRNGVMELWRADNTAPAKWRRAGSCGSGTAVAKTEFDNTSDGTIAMKVTCPGSGLIDVFQDVRVQSGWRYRLVLAAARNQDNANADSAEASICFYRVDPDDWARSDTLKRQFPRYCTRDRSDGDVVRTNDYAGWRIDSNQRVKAGYSWARVVLRTSTTGSGVVFWDDIGFSAYNG